MAHFADGIVTVPTSGTPVALASSGAFHYLYLMAHDDNAGMCHVGASTVVASPSGTARGTLVPQQYPSAAGAFVPLRIDAVGDDYASMADVFIDVQASGDSITWFGLLKD